MNQPAFELNGQTISRDDFYAIACDPGRSIVVEACAGSGKTWILVSRMVRALLQGCAPHEILAITFTKKAAGEMRARLLDWLKDFSQAKPERLAHELLSRGLAKDLDRVALLQQCEALKNLHSSLLTQGRGVQVRTFHSWFAALLRTAPLAVLERMGLPSKYQLLEDDSQAVAQVWRRFAKRVADDVAARQDYLDAVAEHGRHQTRKALEKVLSKRIEFTLADQHGVVDASVLTLGQQFPQYQGCSHPREWLTQAAHARQLLLAAALVLGRASQASFSVRGRELEQAVADADEVGMLQALLTQKGEPRKFNDALSGIAQVRLAQALLQRHLDAQVQHQAYLHQQRMARLTRLLLKEFAQLKVERGWVDMNDVESAALVLLSDPELSGWVQQRLDARISQLLIDEFQDTNPLQWQALNAWLQSYAGAGGGGAAPSVFIVGDPKQSIYRFRRAEPQVFAAARQFVVDALAGDVLSCDHTWRNATAIQGLVNQVMQTAQSEGDFADFRMHTTESTLAGAVLCLPQIARESTLASKDQIRSDQSALVNLPQVWRDSLTQARSLPEDSLKAQECRQVALWLARELAEGDLQARDILVLSRKRERLSLMQQALAQQHIASVQPEKNNLAELPVVQDMIALLDALVSPGHDLSLARALKSPLFGLTDADLVQVALLARAQRASSKDQATAPAVGQSWFEILGCSEALPENLKSIAPRLLRWQGWLAALPPHDALDAIYRDAEVLTCFVAAAPAGQRQTTLAHLQAFLLAALSLDGGRYATPYAFARAVKAGGMKAPTRADAQAVRLLTIHGAKGLESRLVLLLDTDAKESSAETMGVLVDWPGEAKFPQKFIFLASEARPPSCAVAVLAQERQARAREELNALYVAMTRAKQQLVLSSTQAHHAHPGSWWQRMTPHAKPIEIASPYLTGAESLSNNSSPASSVFTLPLLLQLPILQPVLQAGLQTPQPALGLNSELAEAPSSLASRIGQAMHSLLQWHRGGALVGAPSQIKALAQQWALTPDQALEATGMAQRIVAGQGAWAWDKNQLAWQGNEVTLLQESKVLRLDRLVQHKLTGQWWVLDYKSAAQPQQHAELQLQLKNYRAAVQAAQPGQVVRAAFLTASGAMIELNEK